MKSGLSTAALAALLAASTPTETGAPAIPPPPPATPGLGTILPPATMPSGFDPGKLPFEVAYGEETSPYRVNGVFVMPGEDLVMEVKNRGGRDFSATAAAGLLVSRGPGAWTWRAPESPGLHSLTVKQMDGDSMQLNAFVMVPASRMRGGYLEGYRIGKYPERPLKALRFYRNPRGFIRVDSQTAAALVSPHFRLGQFLCKQSQGYPSFLVLRERLVLKLEAVLEEVNRAGYRCDNFHVMSGYRTPWYNRDIGNVKHSAHQFGGAADVFIDENPVDGSMDDLNGDGISDEKDSKILFGIVDRMSLNKYYLPYLGGVGQYNRNNIHGPFVHVDVRGFRAIW
ncbi:MAG TPA: D-Ala-D-Ala carboxypeptidase family metallohydrolase [Fibrobacteria bacterium]|nr:D-Ala-D-Ala carboxypeptidase family metallohydrolase [Fibrobacteria bacterium]